MALRARKVLGTFEKRAPGLSHQLEEVVKQCPTCIKERINPAEPVIPSELPGRPWQKVAADLFELKGHPYLLVKDYFSRYIEVTKLPSTTSTVLSCLLIILTCSPKAELRRAQPNGIGWMHVKGASGSRQTTMNDLGAQQPSQMFLTSPDVSVHLQSMFARHCILKQLISDNGPQFSSTSFAKSARTMDLLIS